MYKTFRELAIGAIHEHKRVRTEDVDAARGRVQKLERQLKEIKETDAELIKLRSAASALSTVDEYKERAAQLKSMTLMVKEWESGNTVAENRALDYLETEIISLNESIKLGLSARVHILKQNSDVFKATEIRKVQEELDLARERLCQMTIDHLNYESYLRSIDEAEAKFAQKKEHINPGQETKSIG